MTEFTKELKGIFEYIQNTLLRKDIHTDISVEYFIVSVLENEESVAYKTLSKIMFHDNIEESKKHFKDIISLKEDNGKDISKYDDTFELCIKNAKMLASKQKTNQINSGHVLFFVMLTSPETNKYFKKFGVTLNQIKIQVQEETNNIETEEKDNETFVSTKPQKHEKKPKTTNEKKENTTPKNNTIQKIDGECGRVTKNLNEMALNFQIDTIYGNEDIYEEIFNVLSKRDKNNVVVVGKSGVGKSDTVRNIANLIVNGDVPKSFTDKILLEVDFNSLFVDTHMRGAFETRMKSIVNEINQNGNYIFFIDSLNKALNGHFTQNDVEEFVDTLITNRNVMVICTCSEKDYTKQISDNPSWERYFEKVTIEEPDHDKCMKILRHHADKLEVFHDVLYDDESLETAIKFSKRYITERCLPDSAIDVLDKCGAKKSLENVESEKVLQCRKKLNDVRNEIAEKKETRDEGNIMEFDELLRKEIELNTELDFAIKEYNLSKTKPLISDKDIKFCVSKKTNIPVTDLTADDKEKLKNINERIKKIVIGQDEAVDTVCKAIKRQRIGLSNPNKPVVFFFGGSTGVGKTFLAKTIAKEVFGSENKIVRLDMSEYADKTSVTKLYGSGSGFVGHDNGGILTEAIKKNKHCVLLLDEIEKADEEVHNVFLSTFDEGRLTDNKGITVDFKNVIVIMTSNLGAKELDEKGNGIGFLKNVDDIKNEVIEKELKRKFKPEFINRIDKIVYFNKLTDENIKNIISLEINNVRKRLETMGYGLQENMEDTKLFETIYNNVIKEKKMGARPIIRELQNLIEDKITDYIIETNIENGHVFTETELS